MINPYYQDEFGILYCGLAEEILPQLEPNSVHTVCCSPPYWQVRKYSSDNELGLEVDYREYLKNLCNILDFVKVPLLITGSLWVNIGDKYFSKVVKNREENFEQSTKIVPLMKEGILMQIPERFAIKMNDEYSWYLKHRIIWVKPNAFPTSNKRKFTLDYEYIYHFVLDLKNYYFEQQFEPSTQETKERLRNILRQDIDNLKEPYKNNAPRAHRHNKNIDVVKDMLKRGRNKRSVWNIPIGVDRGYSHIAAYPVALMETPIKATCPKNGTVLDPFFGSGTTAITAEKLNRKWIGIEVKEEYCEEAVLRILNERTRYK